MLALTTVALVARVHAVGTAYVPEPCSVTTCGAGTYRTSLCVPGVPALLVDADNNISTSTLSFSGLWVVVSSVSAGMILSFFCFCFSPPPILLRAHHFFFQTATGVKGPAYLHDRNDKTVFKTVTYRFTIATATSYEIDVSYLSGANRCSQSPYSVASALGSTTFPINQVCAQQLAC